jgi:hypothetical protein
MQHAVVHFADTVITLQEWEAFCSEHGIERVNGATGGNLWRRGGRMGVECAFGQAARYAMGEPPEHAADVVFTSMWGGEKVGELAKLAGEFWIRFGGSMTAAEQVRRAIAHDASESR